MKLGYCVECGSKLARHNDTHYVCEQGHDYWNSPKAAVTLAMVRNESLLFVKRAIEPHKGMYGLPGGFTDYGEGAYEAAIREASEELGVVIKHKDLHLLEAYPSYYVENVTTVDIVFLVTVWHGEPYAKSEVTTLYWGPYNFVYDSRFSEPTYKGLDKLIERQIR